MSKATDNLRTRNMKKRRARVLNEARNLLASGGSEALNLRDLARLADVTVPTIYNLVGRKEDILLALAAEVVTEIESRIAPAENSEPLSLVAAVVVESIRMFAENENYYRSAFIAVESLDQAGQHHHQVERIYAWVGDLIQKGIDACRKAKLIRGQIRPLSMTKLLTRNFRMSCRGWAFGHYDIEEFRRIALSDLYITLAADAVDIFQQQLYSKISNLAPGTEIAGEKKKIQTKRLGDRA